MSYVGSVFGQLTILSEHAKGYDKRAMCRCSCGKVKDIRLHRVITGFTRSCGCANRRHAVEPGRKYGRLTVLSLDYQTIKGHLKVPVRCDCGNEKFIGVAEIATGKTQSCGCLSVDKLVAMSTKHGGEKTALYSVLRSMKSRCLYPTAESFGNYGGRGITVCQDWLDSFESFRDWANSTGYRAGLQIDRIDVNGNYEPANCRWVTPKVNGNNRRNNVMLTAFGETKTMSDWSSDPRCMAPYSVLNQRISRLGWPHLEAITTPKEPRQKKIKPA